MATGRVPTTANSPLTAKGDLFTYSTAPARLAVGLDGEQIVADSSTSTGLSYQANWAAGKNKVINGAFNIWQRGTTVSNPNGTYLADRFLISNLTAVPTSTYSQQTFTPGTAPVAGYESQYFMRFQVTSQGSSTGQAVNHRIEDVRTFAGQTITFSFWAKAAANLTMNDIKLGQNFGSGGSSATETNFTMSSKAVTTSWQRFTGTVTVPSISGKTVGTSSYVYLYLEILSSQGAYTFDTWGWQLEAGSVATAFQTATGTIQGELAACKYYYQRISSDATSSIAAVQLAFANSTTSAMSLLPIATMRTTPSVGYSALGNFYLSDLIASANYTTTAIAISGIRSTNNVVFITHTVASGLTSGRAYSWQANTTSTYFDLSAEL